MSEIRGIAACAFAGMVFATIWVGALSMMYAVARRPEGRCPGCAEGEPEEAGRHPY